MTSAVRIEANRRNARKSTGPRTAEGKRRSSRNGTRHGLAGQEGVVLSHAERALRARRRKSWGASLAPVGAQETALVEEIVFASVVLDRLQKIEGAALIRWRETAIERFDREQEQQLEAAIAQLAEEPALAVARLRAGAPGCAWLIDRLEELRAVLVREGTLRAEFVDLALRLLGRDPEARYPDRLTDRLLGMISGGAAGAPSPGDEPAWGWVARLLVEEIERLRSRHAALLPSYQHARATAPERAWLPADVAILMIRHGGAWEGRFHRALSQLRRLQKARRRLGALKKRAHEPNAASTQVLEDAESPVGPAPIAAHAAGGPGGVQPAPRRASRLARGRGRAWTRGRYRSRAGRTLAGRRKNRERTQRRSVANRFQVRTCNRSVPSRRARLGDRLPVGWVRVARPITVFGAARLTAVFGVDSPGSSAGFGRVGPRGATRQGFRHGPARVFGVDPAGFSKRWVAPRGPALPVCAPLLGRRAFWNRSPPRSARAVA